MDDIRIVQSSEDSIQVQFPQKICEEVNERISRFVECFKELVPFSLEEIVPTYCAVTVYFDSEKCTYDSVKDVVQKALKRCESSDTGTSKAAETSSGKIVEIPVCYDEEFAPDLHDVAEYTGLSEEEVIRLHLSKDYLIYMLGFLPGFPYLGGMDERLETPRLKNPRTKIPAGSVAIGGKQAGLYPSDSPGGWRIIGRTPLKVFDQNREPACLYKAGDKIRFVKISKEEFFEIEKKESAAEEKCSSLGTKGNHNEHYVCSSGIKILDGGMLSTIQDLGFKGYQNTGIGQSGVMDFESYAYGNWLLENEKNAACIEATLLGPSIQFVLPCDFSITGGECSPTLNEVPVKMNQVVHTNAGDVLKCGYITKGLRTYICFKGGILVPKILGSRATNLKSKMGGLMGRKLQAGDELAVGDCKGEKSSMPENPMLPAAGEVLILECTKGSQFEQFSQEKVEQFQNTEYTVLPESDRMGIRFCGAGLECGKTDIISDAIPFGAVQITSEGLPVVMAADRQTTGGYAKIAAVKKHSMCLLAQAIPGTKVRFKIGG